jgi:trehalose 6-phosphate phosphatase
MDAAELVAAARARLPGLLVATDFDGTLAPIVPDPQDSHPAPGAIEALCALARRGAHVAVVTGRESATAVRLGGLDVVPGIVVEGLYGLQRWEAGSVTSPEAPAGMTALGERLAGWLREQDVDPAVWIEDKQLSYVVHTRRAADSAAEQAALREPARALAAEHGLEVHDGRDVLEFRLPGFHKGDALRRLAAEFGASALLYAGDDLGDLPAFAAARELGGWTIGATSAEVRDLPADVLVDGPQGVIELFRAIADPS